MLFIVGQVGRHYFEKRNIPIDINFHYTAQNPSMNRARHIAKVLVELFEEEKLDEVYVVYTKMVNSMTVEPVISRLLPLKKEHIEIQNENNYRVSLQRAQCQNDGYGNRYGRGIRYA